jgi:hypothetical protein
MNKQPNHPHFKAYLYAKTSLDSFTRKLQLLQQSTMAFSKILKKYDKQSHSNLYDLTMKRLQTSHPFVFHHYYDQETTTTTMTEKEDPQQPHHDDDDADNQNNNYHNHNNEFFVQSLQTCCTVLLEMVLATSSPGRMEQPYGIYHWII